MGAGWRRGGGGAMEEGWWGRDGGVVCMCGYLGTCARSHMNMSRKLVCNCSRERQRGARSIRGAETLRGQG